LTTDFATSKEGPSEMPAPSSPPWSPGSAGSGYRRHFRYGNGDLRASDAERADVADRLSRHYQDGRLDQAEFNERLDRAMNAKTRADFNGLFADLPDLPDPTDQAGQAGKKGQSSRPPFNPGRVQQRHARRNSVSYIVFLAFVALVTYIVAHTLMHSVFLWLVVTAAAFLWLRSEHMRRRR
jgi:Flp pilus assembly protein TadB